MDVCIFYEHAQRELTNAFLLKFELERRGYEVDILKSRQARIPYFRKPKLVITPWLYNDHESIEPVKVCFFRGFDKILNLQSEQVLSKMILNRGFHCPSGLAQNATHVCWSEKIKRRLMSVGVPEDNCLVVGDIKLDFTKYPFNTFFKSKKDLADEFDIPYNHQWNLFISSFAYANLENRDIEFYIDVMGKHNFEELHDVQLKSQKEIVSWIEKFVLEHKEIEFIYRPHPSEFDNKYLKELDEKYSNFHYISIYSIQDWIINCDFINSWFSTSLIDVYMLEKNCNILRPYELNELFDVPYMINAFHIKDFVSFEKNNLVHNTKFPVSDEKLREFYLLDDNFVYKKIVDHIEWMINSDECKSKFYKYPPILESIRLLLSRVFGKTLINFFKGLFSKSEESIEEEEYFDEMRKNELKNFVWDNS